MGTCRLLHLVHLLALGLTLGPGQGTAEDAYPTTQQYPTTGPWRTTTSRYPTTTRPWRTTTRPWYTTTRPWYTTTRPWRTTTSRYPTTTAYPTKGCPAGWVDSIEGCFYFHYSQALTWGAAQYECEKLGGFLAEPRTQEQADLLKSLAFVEDTFVRVESWWIGLTDQGHEGRWIWQHVAENVNYTDWVAGSPSHGVNDADCAVMHHRDQYRWSDTDCRHSKAAPVCQREDGEDAPTTASPQPTHYPTSSPSYYVALVGGRTSSWEAYGNVFAVNSNGYYGPVCDDEFGWQEAAVVCRQLGYDYGNAYQGSHWGRVPEQMAMDDLRCTGNEYHLQNCPYNTNDNCVVIEGAGVHCYMGSGTSTPRYSTTSWYAGTDKGSEP